MTNTMEMFVTDACRKCDLRLMALTGHVDCWCIYRRACQPCTLTRHRAKVLSRAQAVECAAEIKQEQVRALPKPIECALRSEAANWVCMPRSFKPSV